MGVSLFRGAARRISGLFTAAVALGLAASAAPGCSGSDAKITAVCSGPGPCQTRLTLLHTSDIHSRLIPYDLVITQVDADLGLGINGELKNVGGAARAWGTSSVASAPAPTASCTKNGDAAVTIATRASSVPMRNSYAFATTSPPPRHPG